MSSFFFSPLLLPMMSKSFDSRGNIKFLTLFSSASNFGIVSRTYGGGVLFFFFSLLFYVPTIFDIILSLFGLIGETSSSGVAARGTLYSSSYPLSSIHPAPFLHVEALLVLGWTLF